MPALLEDPSTRIPPPQAHSNAASTLSPRQRTLPKAENAGVTLYPISKGPGSLPQDLSAFLHAEFSAEIERGATYPMEQAMSLDQFRDYWFGTFAVVAVLDEEGAAPGEGLREGRKWEDVCLGTFYIKPNYPGEFISDSFLYASRSSQYMSRLQSERMHVHYVLTSMLGRCSHICNAGFMTTNAARGKGVGQVMGETYLEFAPQLVNYSSHYDVVYHYTY